MFTAQATAGFDETGSSATTGASRSYAAVDDDSDDMALNGWPTSNNGTPALLPLDIPPEMTFTDDNLLSVVVYSVLCVVATVGNLTVFGTLYVSCCDHLRSRINLFIVHLHVRCLLKADPPG